MNKPDPNALVKRRVGAPTFNFPHVVMNEKTLNEKFVSGSKIAGEVVHREVTQQTDTDNNPKFWDAEQQKPMWQLVITLQSDVERDGPDDDGKRRIFAKYKMLDAISEAVEEADAEGIEVGGYLEVEHHDIVPPEKKGRSGTKLFRAKYTPLADRVASGKTSAPVAETQDDDAGVHTAKPSTTEEVDIDPAAAQAALDALPEALKRQFGLIK